MYTHCSWTYVDSRDYTMTCRFTLCIAASLLIVACGVNSSDEPHRTPTASGIEVRLTANKVPCYLGTATLSCSYKVVTKTLPVWGTTTSPEGHFRVSQHAL